MKTKLSLRDYCWILAAYFRGKVLKQKAYRPQDDGAFIYFQGVSGGTMQRMVVLLRLWGARPATVKELLSVTLMDTSKSHLPSNSYPGWWGDGEASKLGWKLSDRKPDDNRVPFLHWDGDGFKETDGSDWGLSSSRRF